MNNRYLYQGKIYNCSEVTTEAELYGANCSYGYGKTLLFLDELEGGNYVDANDCLQVSPNFFLHLRFWILTRIFNLKANVLALFQPKCPDVDYEEF